MCRDRPICSPRPINLAFTVSVQPITAASNVGLSFYYQAGGNGDYPEQNDFAFGFLQSRWPKNGAWFGTRFGFNNPNPQDTLFKGVLIKVDTAYLKDGFRLRFRNSANTTGDWDSLELDYIKLMWTATPFFDTSYVDYNVWQYARAAAKKYSMMPYEQYDHPKSFHEPIFKKQQCQSA